MPKVWDLTDFSHCFGVLNNELAIMYSLKWLDLTTIALQA